MSYVLRPAGIHRMLPRAGIRASQFRGYVPGRGIFRVFPPLTGLTSPRRHELAQSATATCRRLRHHAACQQYLPSRLQSPTAAIVCRRNTVLGEVVRLGACFSEDVRAVNAPSGDIHERRVQLRDTRRAVPSVQRIQPHRALSAHVIILMSAPEPALNGEDQWIPPAIPNDRRLATQLPSSAVYDALRWRTVDRLFRSRTREPYCVSAASTLPSVW